MKNLLRMLSVCFVLGLTNIGFAQYVPYSKHFAIENSYESGRETIIFAELRLRTQDKRDATLHFRKYATSTKILLTVTTRTSDYFYRSYKELNFPYACHTDNSHAGIQFESSGRYLLESSSNKTICPDSKGTLSRGFIIDLKKIPSPRNIKLDRNPSHYTEQKELMPFAVNFIDDNHRGYTTAFTIKDNSNRSFDKFETILIEAKEILAGNMKPKPVGELLR